MTDLNEHETRQKKRQDLISAGISPYASHFHKTHSCAELIKLSENYNMPSAEMLMENGAASSYSTAGRVMMFRTHGKLSFIKLQDESGDIQLAFVKDQCKLIVNDGNTIETITIDNSEISAYKFVEKYIDIADFIGAKGELFVTKHGELTLFVNEFQLLSKALKPLGDKWHGIKDEEMIYRQRYLDMTMNRDSLERMRLRSNFIRTMREFYWSHNFLEIDCPVLTPAASGAAAQPFKTHHNDFDSDFYLRICNETELKKATVGGFEKVFTIASCFRNEGSDPSHLQEFTMLEHQNVYKSYHEDMKFTELMFDHIFDTLQLNRKISVKDKNGNSREVDFTTPWPKIDYVESVNKASGLDITQYGIDDADALRRDIKAKGIEFIGMDQMGTMTLIDYLYKKVLRPSLTGPVFIYHYPRIIAPLARISDLDPNKCEKRQVVVNGWEIINSYGELVDPVKQRESFDEQAKAEAGGDNEATSADLDYVQAMEHGMPIQAGFGMGIDRMLAIISQQDNLRDVVMFPLMKKKTEIEDQKSDSEIVLPEQLPPYSNKTSEVQEENSKTNSPLEKEGEEGDLGAEQDYGTLPTRSQAESLATKYLTETLLHCQQVANVMEKFAEKLGENKDLWYMVGLLHDVDRDYIKKDGSKHLKTEFDAIIDEIDAPQLMRDDIKSHGEWLTGVPVNSPIRKYLASIDELSGFLYAYSRMRPTGFAGMEVSGVKKRLKDKTFAAGVDRAHVMHCEKYLGVSFDEFCNEVIGYMG